MHIVHTTHLGHPDRDLLGRHGCYVSYSDACVGDFHVFRLVDWLVGWLGFIAYQPL